MKDSSIKENIAFGVASENIDIERVIKVAKQARILEMIKAWKDN